MKKNSDTVSYEVIYKNGHFYSEHNKRLVFREQAKYQISGNEYSFQTKDELLETHAVSTPEQMKAYVTKKFGDENIIYLLPAGTEFFFRFGLGRRKSDIKIKSYSFKGKFLEDVYLYKIQEAEAGKVKSWRVVDCITSIDRSLEDNFQLSEPVTADSPAKAFAMLIGTHFDRQRSTSLIIYSYYKVMDKQVINKFCTQSNKPLSLGQLRKIAVDLLPKKDESDSSPRIQKNAFGQT